MPLKGLVERLLVILSETKKACLECNQLISIGHKKCPVCKIDLTSRMNFIGPQDSENCPDCAKAVAGGPYRWFEATIPSKGTQCGNRCRHALQGIVPQR